MSQVLFYPDDHRYTVDGVEVPAVSNVLKKWKIIPFGDYTNNYIEKRKADGTFFHYEADLVNKGVLDLSDMLSPEASQFAKWFTALLAHPLYSEKICHYGTVYAGTCDMIYQDGADLVLVDYKTGSYHKRQHSWQLTLYKKALAEEGINITRMEIWCFADDTIHVVEPISDAEVNALLEKEAQGLSPETTDIDKATDGKLATLTSMLAQAREFEEAVKKATKDIDDVKAKILEYMLTNNITSAENEQVKLTAVQPTTRETFDSKALKAAHPDIYKDYVKTSQAKASLRVTWRDEE